MNKGKAGVLSHLGRFLSIYVVGRHVLPLVEIWIVRFMKHLLISNTLLAC